MLSLKTVVLGLSAALIVHARPKCGRICAADECFAKASLPAEYQPTLTSFCLAYLSTTPATMTATSTVTTTFTTTGTALTTGTSVQTASGTVSDTFTATATATVTVTPTADPATVTMTQTSFTQVVTTEGTACAVTVTTTLPTVFGYTFRGNAPLSKRSLGTTEAPAVAVPTELSQGCKTAGLPAKLSAACSCILQTTTTTVTVTATATSSAQVTATDIATDVTTALQTVIQTITETVTGTATAPTAPPATEMATTTSILLSTTQPCTSTSTSYVYNSGAGFTCGIANPSTTGTGDVKASCTQPAPAGRTNSFFRIEGNGSEGTVFEGCIITGPENITTPSGGTHLCDGTNNNANPSPGGTLTTAINDAGSLNGFDFDGSYSSQFQDFFIQRISASAQTNNQFWGVMRDLVFTAAGGCQEQIIPGTEGLWMFNAFNMNTFLQISPSYQVVKLGDTASVTVTVTGTDGNGSAASPVGGATIAGQTTDANGNVQITVPTTPGCYQFKAERSGSARSNAFFLTVMP